jgi:CRISPR system Cascade subunit CasB
MDRYVLKFLPEDTGVGQEEPYYLVASLFAFWHQGQDGAESTEGNLGRSLRTLVEQEEDPNRRRKLEKSTEKRLIALLNCHRDDLPEHLRQIVSLLKAKEVPLDWAQLLSDIKHWERDDRPVQKAWARGFWIGSRQREPEEAAHAEVSASKADEG